MNISDQLAKQFANEPISTQATLTVRVNVEPSNLVGDLAFVLHNELHRVLGSAGTHLLQDVAAEDVRKYINTVIWMRVNHVNGVRDNVTKEYAAQYRRCAVPVLVYQLLIGIGEALDRDYGLRFIPEIDLDANDILGPADFIKLSNVMFAAQNNGFKVVGGLPNNPIGELPFMAMQHVSQTVTSYRKDHPVYGFLAAFFKQEQLNSVTGTMHRIVYGYESDYAVNLAHLASAIGGVD